MDRRPGFCWKYALLELSLGGLGKLLYFWDVRETIFAWKNNISTFFEACVSQIIIIHGFSWKLDLNFRWEIREKMKHCAVCKADDFVCLLKNVMNRFMLFQFLGFLGKHETESIQRFDYQFSDFLAPHVYLLPKKVARDVGTRRASSNPSVHFWNVNFLNISSGFYDSLETYSSMQPKSASK